VPRRTVGLLAAATVVVVLGPACDGCGGEESIRPLRCAPAEGAEVDLAKHARLRASDTRGDPVFSWVREAEDGIATVRDSDPATSWKVPRGVEAVVEVDFQPWLGRPVSLERLELDFAGDAPRVVVEILDGCGGQVLAAFPDWPADGALDLERECAACVAIRMRSDGDTSLDALRLLSRDGSIEAPELEVSDIDPPDRRLARSGVVEGFYGVPWSWRERRTMVMSLAAAGLDTYLYAPKHDDLHRAEWREPYPDATVADFAALGELGAALGVTVYFGISPFIDYDDSTTDYDVLRDKLALFLSQGIAGVAVLADDIELTADVAVDGDLGALHVSVVNRLVADLRAEDPEARFLFVPTVYSDDRTDDLGDGPAYLSALAGLDPEVGVMWTGRGTFCAEMSAGDMTRFTDLVGRPPIIWDNIWANDATDPFFGSLLLSPLEGRSTDLPGAVDGLTFNLSIQGAVSRLAADMAAAFLSDPSDQDADSARAFAADLETVFSAGAASDPAREAGLLEFVMELHDGHALRPPPATPVVEAVAALRDAIGDGLPVPVEQAAALLDLLARMTTLGGAVQDSGLETDLVDELAFPLEKARHEAEAGLRTLELLGERLSGRPGDEARAAAQAAFDASQRSRYQLGHSEVMALFQEVAAIDRADQGFVRPRPGDSPASCRAGEPIAFRPFALEVGDGVAVSVHGLPGAEIDGATVRFTPRYAGRFRGVAVASVTGPHPGWAFRELVLICRPAATDEL